MGDGKRSYRFVLGDLMERGRLEDLEVDGSIILKWISEKWD
jgi:hypothetical protein